MFQAASSPSKGSDVASPWSGVLRFGVVFSFAYVLLFLLSDRMVGVYDESFPLVNALRLMAGMVPHRDFYTPYGPGQSYLLAGLFKLTHPSLLVGSLLDLAYKAAIVASTGQILTFFCRKIVVYAGMLGALLLILATNSNGSALAPIALTMLWSTWLLDSLLESDSRRHAYVCGLLAGFIFFIRYDIGLALVMLYSLLLAVACVYLWKTAGRAKILSWVLFLCGFSTLALPLLLFYVKAGAMKDFIFGLLVYPRKYYQAGRSLPFPRPALHEPLDTIIYLSFLIVGSALLVYAAVWLGNRGKQTFENSPRVWRACAVFVCLAALMTLKGVVRPGVVQAFLGTICGLVALCLLVECLVDRRGRLRVYVAFVCLLVAFETSFTAMRQVRTMKRQHTLMLQAFYGQKSPVESAWCADHNALTRDVCYLTDLDHMQAAKYVEEHTKPSDWLYIGLPAHDRVLVSDNLEYFADLRLPATRWSHFDPDLQNTAPVQRQMIAELEKTKPPVILLDAEFDDIREPNDSSKSSGVHLLDDYLHAHYKLTEVFGKMQAAERK